MRNRIEKIRDLGAEIDVAMAAGDWALVKKLRSQQREEEETEAAKVRHCTGSRGPRKPKPLPDYAGMKGIPEVIARVLHGTARFDVREQLAVWIDMRIRKVAPGLDEHTRAVIAADLGARIEAKWSDIYSQQHAGCADILRRLGLPPLKAAPYPLDEEGNADAAQAALFPSEKPAENAEETPTPESPAEPAEAQESTAPAKDDPAPAAAPANSGETGETGGTTDGDLDRFIASVE